MAHLREIVAPRCERCGGRATVTLVNGVNAPIGVYCRHHGGLALRAFRSTGAST
jgi:hypothetical protein